MAGVAFLDTAKWYDPLFTNVLSDLRNLAARVAPFREGMKILDIGCGTGKQLTSCQNRGSELFGIDLSLQMLRVAKFNLNGSAGLINGDALHLPFPGLTFDLIMASLFLHQLNAQLCSFVVAEAVRVLKPGGQLLLIDFHRTEDRSIKGNLTYFAISILEFFAGREHYNNSRQFLSQGGIPTLTDKWGLSLQKTIVLSNGNIGIYLLNLS
ncbi:MAG: class I SAM-dependent methyltransferase [Chloroflexota bacterium]|nr:MAG: class I SAM-dependent methyltransferase [Chloroflexota bacterium]